MCSATRHDPMSGRIMDNAEAGPSFPLLLRAASWACAHGTLRLSNPHCCDVFRVGSGVHRRRYDPSSLLRRLDCVRFRRVKNPFGVALMTTFTQIAACSGPSALHWTYVLPRKRRAQLRRTEIAAVAQGLPLPYASLPLLALVSAIGATVFCRAALKRTAPPLTTPKPSNPLKSPCLWKRPPLS